MRHLPIHIYFATRTYYHLLAGAFHSHQVLNIILGNKTQYGVKDILMKLQKNRNMWFKGSLNHNVFNHVVQQLWFFVSNAFILQTKCHYCIVRSFLWGNECCFPFKLWVYAYKIITSKIICKRTSSCWWQFGLSACCHLAKGSHHLKMPSLYSQRIRGSCSLSSEPLRYWPTIQDIAPHRRSLSLAASKFHLLL